MAARSRACTHWHRIDVNLESGGIVMKPIRSIRRFAGLLAGLIGTAVAFSAAAPAALAMNAPPPGTSEVTPVPPAPVTLVAGGMAGWQITLIALGAALLAATLAVLVDRVRARRHTTTAPAT